MKNIIFIAPPAAGKGTISDYLVKKFNYKHISTGDLLRDEIASGSEFGKEIDNIIKNGSLVDDEIVIKLVQKNLLAINESPFILDGFPRTLAQALKLDTMLNDLNVKNILVVYLTIDLDTILNRVRGRVICPKCKKSYNLNNDKLKPIMDNICDDCGATLEKRNDDNEETFVVRYQKFIENSRPILDFYQGKNLLVNVDATLPLEVIYEKLENEAEIWVENRCSND